MAGAMMIALGLSGLGSAIAFIPRPIVVGFTNGIAILIVSTQIKDFFGLDVPERATDFSGRMRALVAHAGTLDRTTTLLAVASLIVAFALPRIAPPRTARPGWRT